MESLAALRLGVSSTACRARMVSLYCSVTGVHPRLHAAHERRAQGAILRGARTISGLSCVLQTMVRHLSSANPAPDESRAVQSICSMHDESSSIDASQGVRLLPQLSTRQYSDL